MDSEETLNDCSICIESLNTNKHEITTLQCGHMFHHKCITQWANSNQNVMECPLCRAKYNIEPNTILYIDTEPQNENMVGNIINRLIIIKFTKRRFIIMSFTMIDIIFGMIHMVISGHISIVIGICMSLWGYLGAKLLRIDYLVGYLSICVFKTIIMILTATEYIHNLIVNNTDTVAIIKNNQNMYILYFLILCINIYMSYITFYLIKNIKSYRDTLLQIIYRSTTEP